MGRDLCETWGHRTPQRDLGGGSRPGGTALRREVLGQYWRSALPRSSAFCSGFLCGFARKSANRKIARKDAKTPRRPGETGGYWYGGLWVCMSCQVLCPLCPQAFWAYPGLLIPHDPPGLPQLPRTADYES